MLRLPYTFLLGALCLSVHAQVTPAPAPSAAPSGGPLPLTLYTFTYPNLPDKVDPFQSTRGPQTGYNRCNASTEGPNSLCQTAIFNTIDDFCMWGSPTPNGVIGNLEGEVVAYCTKPGHGARLIPPGTLTAVQFIKAPGYIQVTGLMNQVGIGLAPDDAGGELDPHGADLLGNPLGGLVFSNNLPTAKDSSYIQVNNWNNFIGGGQFCFKACDPTINSPDYCENRFDTMGCAFNMPAAYAPGIFLSCLGDNQAPAGGPPVIPATSSCTTYTSSLLYPNTATTKTGPTTTAGAASTATSRATSTANAGSLGANVPSVAQSGFAFIATAAIAALAGAVLVF